jgi:hypothetical protein
VAEVNRVGPGGYVHGWIKVGGVKTPAGSYPSDVKFMKTEDIGKLTSDLEPHLTVEQRYQSKTADATQAQLDKAIAKQGWHPSPLEVLNGERLTDGHHTYAAARARGVSHLPVRHYQRATRHRLFVQRTQAMRRRAGML